VRLTLTPSTDPADYGFVHQIRTRFAETDAMGVIHHGAYAPYLEEARVELLRRAERPYEGIREEGIDLAVLEFYVRYRRPLYFDEVVDIGVAVGHLARTTFQVGYLLQVAGETRSTAVTVHGAVNNDGRPTQMPAWLAGVVSPTAPWR
jgi:acyl-CoA thioester hydrolase